MLAAISGAEVAPGQGLGPPRDELVESAAPSDLTAAEVGEGPVGRVDGTRAGQECTPNRLRLVAEELEGAGEAGVGRFRVHGHERGAEPALQPRALCQELGREAADPALQGPIASLLEEESGHAP